MAYISHIPRPLLDDLVRGNWLPIIGAGMSRNAVIPSGLPIPLWSELGQSLAKEMADYPYVGALDTLSAYEHEFGRPKLIERLLDLLRIEEAQPGQAHRAFCSIPFDLVCTTNFDFLLERQYETTPRYCRPVIDEDQLSVNLRDAGLLLLKLHGDLHHPNRLIVTEADYDGFLAGFPLLATFLANLLITRTGVLIGYSLDDPDFRQIWHIVSDRLGKARRLAYALTVGAKPAVMARFERRGVKVVNLPGKRSQYSSILATLFDELRDYMRDNVMSVSQVTEEEPLRELSLPRDAATRLCFVAVPIELLPFYKDRVFPVARECGFVPVTGDDVISPGDTIVAKIDSLIDRASVVVVEPSSPWTMAELRMATAHVGKRSVRSEDSMRPTRPYIIAVASDPEQIPTELDGMQFIRRPNVLKQDPEPFLSALRDRFRTIAQSLKQGISDEPSRLFEAREFRAAVIAAISLLETALRQRLGKSELPRGQPMSLRRLVELAALENLLPPGSSEEVMSWIVLRNEVVHSNAQVSRSKAREIVEGIKGIIGVL